MTGDRTVGTLPVRELIRRLSSAPWNAVVPNAEIQPAARALAGYAAVTPWQVYGVHAFDLTLTIPARSRRFDRRCATDALICFLGNADRDRFVSAASGGRILSLIFEMRRLLDEPWRSAMFAVLSVSDVDERSPEASVWFDVQVAPRVPRSVFLTCWGDLYVGTVDDLSVAWYWDASGQAWVDLSGGTWRDSVTRSWREALQQGHADCG